MTFKGIVGVWFVGPVMKRVYHSHRFITHQFGVYEIHSRGSLFFPLQTLNIYTLFHTIFYQPNINNRNDTLFHIHCHSISYQIRYSLSFLSTNQTGPKCFSNTPLALHDLVRVQQQANNNKDANGVDNILNLALDINLNGTLISIR